MNYGYASESGNAPVSFSYSQLEKEGVAVEGQKFPDKRYGSLTLIQFNDARPSYVRHAQMDQFWPAAHQFLAEGMTRNTRENQYRARFLLK